MIRARMFPTSFVVGLVIGLMFTSEGRAQTQYEFDRAVRCCWTGDTSDCSTPRACVLGYESCLSKHFYGFSSDGYLQCDAMGSRGEDDDAFRLFVPPAPQETSDGEILEVSPVVANSLRAATRVMELQRRGASREELDKVATDGVEIGVEDAGDGAQVITIRGEGADDIVLRFDSAGSLQQQTEKVE